MSRSMIDLSACTAGPGVTLGPEGVLGFAAAPDATMTSYDFALDAGEQEIVIRFQMGGRLPDISVHVWSEVGELLCSRRISTRVQRAALRFSVSAPIVAKVVIDSNSSSFDLTAIEYGRLVREGATAATRRARREQVLAGLGLDPTSAAEQPFSETPSATEIESALFGSADIAVLPYDTLAHHAETLRAIGVDLAAVQSLFQQDSHSADLAGDVPLSPGSTLLTGNPKLRTLFQDEVVRSGRLSIRDPCTGETRQTTNGYVLDVTPILATIVYEFMGPDPILVGTSLGWIGNLSFLWLIDKDVIIHKNLDNCDWVDPQQVICRYVAACLEHSSEVRRYRESEHSTALVSGVLTNLGHYFWNDISGVERLLRNEALERVEAFYTTTNPWISVAEIFGDVLPCPVHELSSPAELFSQLLYDRCLPVRPTATAIDRALAARVHRAAERLAAHRGTGLANRLNIAVSSSKFIFFVNLRVHNKSWVEQVQGLAAMAQRLDAHYGRDVLIYLDGYKDCDETVHEVRNAVAHLDVEIVDGTLATLSETILWAYACNMFVAVVGSGLALLTWLADKDGIAYSDIAHRNQLEWWDDVGVGGSAVLLAPGREDISDVTTGDYVNYSISPSTLIDLLDSLMAQRKERH